MLGAPLYDATGVSFPFTTTAVVLAETFVAMPFLIISVEGALRAADRRYEDAAATLGASRATTFRRVTLPLVAPESPPGRCCVGPGRSVNSERPSRSPATFPVRRAR